MGEKRARVTGFSVYSYFFWESNSHAVKYPPIIRAWVQISAPLLVTSRCRLEATMVETWWCA